MMMMMTMSGDKGMLRSDKCFTAAMVFYLLLFIIIFAGVLYVYVGWALKAHSGLAPEHNSDLLTP